MYKFIYFTEDILTTDFEIDLMHLSNWYKDPSKFESKLRILNYLGFCELKNFERSLRSYFPIE